VKLSRVIQLIEFRSLKNFHEMEISGIECDSRRISPNILFACISGYSEDGHKYAEDAVRLGAKALLVEKELALPETIAQIRVENCRIALSKLAHEFNGKPSEAMHITGITGTNGKSSCAWLLRAINNSIGFKTGLIGTIEYDTVKRTIEASRTTPDGLALQNYLREMRDAGASHVAMEVTSIGLVLDRVSDVDFDAGCFINLTRDHLDFHGDMERYREAKGLLFKMLKEDAVAILNADDPASEYYKGITKAKIMTFGIRNKADVMAEDLEIDISGIRFRLCLPGVCVKVALPLVGEYGCTDALAAAACSWAGTVQKKQAIKGVDGPDDLARRIGWGLESCSGIPGRLQRVSDGQGRTIFVDYAHTGHALESVLGALRPLVKDGRLITVFGAGGNRDKGKRPLMARQVERFSDLFWVTSDNPRFEEPDAIIADVMTGITDRGRCRIEPDREIAIRQAVFEMETGDVLVIAGKGHEKAQSIKGVNYEFDDVEVASKCAAEAGKIDIHLLDGLQVRQREARRRRA